MSSIEFTFDNHVQALYIAYYGRPADPEGLSYWVERLEGGEDFAQVVNAFGVSEEFTQHFDELDNATLINNVYQQVFNRDADEEGLAFYTNLLETGSATLATISKQVVDGAQGDDQMILSQKTVLAGGFTESVEALDRSYEGEEAIGAATELLATITADQSSLETGFSAIDSIVQSFSSDLEGYYYIPEEVCEDDDTGKNIMIEYDPQKHSELNDNNQKSDEEKDGTAKNIMIEYDPQKYSELNDNNQKSDEGKDGTVKNIMIEYDPQKHSELNDNRQESDEDKDNIVVNVMIEYDPQKHLEESNITYYGSDKDGAEYQTDNSLASSWQYNDNSDQLYYQSYDDTYGEVGSLNVEQYGTEGEGNLALVGISDSDNGCPTYEMY